MLCSSYKYVIITASGKGERMKTDIPKQFLLIRNKPLLLHTLISVYNANKDYNIIIVLNEEHLHYWNEIVEKYNVTIPHKIIFGGEERFYSVQNAVNYIKTQVDEALVAVHDGVRPFAENLFEECFKVCEEKGNAVCCIKSVDSLRQINDNHTQSIDRNKVLLVQTPQCFKLSSLYNAYKQEYSPTFTDDASVVERMGEEIHICNGDRKNIKITTPFDLAIAQTLI